MAAPSPSEQQAADCTESESSSSPAPAEHLKLQCQFSDQSTASRSSRKSKSKLSKTTVVPNPHGITSLRQLTRMKVIDTHSLHVFGICPPWSSPELLCGPLMFGRFGAILSVRIIQNQSASRSTTSHNNQNRLQPMQCVPTIPGSVQVLIRFADASSAIVASAWCSVINGLRVQNGYNRYCVKFASGKQCSRKGCSKLHRWAVAYSAYQSPTQ